MVDVDEFSQCFGGLSHFRMASVNIFVLSIREERIIFLLVSVYRQSTDFPARLIKTVVFSNSDSHPVRDLASQFANLIPFLISDFPRVRIVISSKSSLK